MAWTLARGMNGAGRPGEAHRSLGRRGTLAAGTLSAAVLIVLVVLSVYVFPDLLVKHDVGAAAVPKLKPSEALKAKDDVRKTLLQGIGGLLFLATAFFTWRQLQISREGQITEQFNKAIDHLGSAQVDVRLGGIYALERIANTSKEERGPIVEVLTAYIREHAPRPRASDNPGPSSRFRELFGRRAQPHVSDLAPLQARKPDVQAAMLVLARRAVSEHDGTDLDLSGVDLRGAHLAKPKVEVAQFHRVNLQEAVLQASNLEAADLSKADLWRADLRWSNLQSADLRQAILSEADLREANLRGADLRGAKLDGVMFRNAEASSRTKWPDAGSQAQAKAAGVLFIDTPPP
jgi:uncharacterized protein YjbI with pentapeptide repeats